MIYVKYVWIITRKNILAKDDLLVSAMQDLEIKGTVKRVKSHFGYISFCYCFAVIDTFSRDEFFKRLSEFIDIDAFETATKVECANGSPLTPNSERQGNSIFGQISLELAAYRFNRRRRIRLIVFSLLKLNFILAWRHSRGYIRMIFPKLAKGKNNVKPR